MPSKACDNIVMTIMPNCKLKRPQGAGTPGLLVLDAWGHTESMLLLSATLTTFIALTRPLGLSEMDHSEPGQLSGKTARATSMP